MHFLFWIISYIICTPLSPFLSYIQVIMEMWHAVGEGEGWTGDWMVLPCPFLLKSFGFLLLFFYFILDLIPLFWIWYPCFGGKDAQVLIIFLEIVLDPPLTLETFTALTTCRCKNEHDESDFLYLGRKRWLRGTVLRRMKPVPKVSIHVLQLFSVYPISFLSALIVIKIQLSVFC